MKLWCLVAACKQWGKQKNIEDFVDVKFYWVIRVVEDT